jgi:hypothetical protein
MLTPATVTASHRNDWPLVFELPPLAPFPSVPSICRAHLGVTATSWGLGSLADAGQQVVSELTTNAVEASIGSNGDPLYLPGGRMPVVWLRLVSDGIVLVVEVYDQAPGVPSVQPPSADAESGRGLLLVDFLAGQWGWNNLPGGKCVWAVIRPGD